MGRWSDVQPCGTPAAYRRHLRYGEKPCESCKQAEARRDRTAEYQGRQERYRAARDAGLTSDQALAARSRRVFEQIMAGAS